MAIAGDIIIKLAADFAQFVKGMGESTKAVESFGKKVDEQGGTLKEMAKSIADLGKSNSVEQFAGKLEALGKGLVRFGLIGAAAAAVIGGIVAAIQKGRDIEEYAGKIDKLATSLKITTIEAQALEAAARQTGKTAAELNEQLTAAQRRMLGDIYKSAFGDTTKILDDVSKASTRLSDAYNDLAEASHQSMVAMFGDLTAATLNGLTAAIIGWSEAMREASAVLARVAKSPQIPSVGSFIESGQNMSAGIGGGFPTMDAGAIAGPMDIVAEKFKNTQAAVDKLKEQLASTREEFDRDGDRGGVLADEIANLEKKILALTGAMIALNNVATGTAAALSPFAGKGIDLGPNAFKGAGPDVLKPYLPGASEAMRWTTEGLKPKPTGGGGGGGGKSDADSIDAQIARFAALEAAAKKTGETIDKYHATNIEDFQREIRVQQQVEEIAAKLGAKYDKAGETRQRALHDQIAAALEAKSANDKLLEGAQRAADIERKYGDGAAASAKSRRDLDLAEKANIATKGALATATKVQAEADEHQRLQAKRYLDNLDSLAAGFKDAADSYSRANDLFTQGGQLFAGVTSAMGEGLDVLVGKSSKTFGQIASDFANMLAKMALQAALSPVLKYLSASIGSLFGPSGVTPPPLGGTDIGTFPTARAGGGDVYGGQPYWVGEYGPERFVPQGAGRIEPAGGGDVYVNIANYTDSKVSASKSKGPGGKMQVDVLVEAVESQIAGRVSRGQGSLGKTLEGTYGMQRVGR